MAIKWKLFKKSFPYACDKCGALANMKRDYCETCGTENSLRDITKEDYAKYLKD